MRVRAFFLAALIAFMSATARADIIVLSEPDKWIEQALQDIAAGKLDEFARNYLSLIDKNTPDNITWFSDQLSPLSRAGTPAFIEKVWEASYGTAMRQVVYLMLYRQTDYTYFNFVLKKNRGGWAITNFSYKSEPAGVFPPGFVWPR